jgi:general secretion pathway protein A
VYTAFFGLREKPFALSPDPRFLFLSAAHREALAHLLYGIEQGEGFIAVTGEVGTGKTTLCRTLLRRLGGEVEVAFVFNPKLSARELLEAILVELGVEKRGDSARELVDELNHYLLERRRQGRRVLLIIDEAQGLASDTLEQVRLLSNLETETDKLIQILLLGQPELDALLESRELRQLRQRIGVRWRLAPLSRDEAGAYVRHRLRVSAGSDRDHLFAESALREVYRRSHGIPRVVNLLCDRALLAAFAESAPAIRPAHVRRAAREVEIGRGGAEPRRLRRLALPFAALLGLALIAAAGWRLGAWERVVELAKRGAAAPAAQAAPDVSAPPPAAPIAATPPASTAAAPEPSAAPAAPAVSALPPPAVTEPAGTPPANAEPIPAPPTASAAPAPAPAAAGPERVTDLAHALALRAPGAIAADSLAAVLEAWSLPRPDPLPEALAFPELVAGLSARGLGLIDIHDADVARLRALGQPALLAVDAADGVPRLVALHQLGGSDVELIGVLAGRPAVVSADDLARSWHGEAHVAWRDFEPLPDLLRVGDAGDGVSWLQRSLGELGFWSGPASGRFDAATELAVRAFQADRRLEPDGTVGPLTKISLYQALRRYGVPVLAPLGGAG